jgi:hypothetical protein
MKKLDTQVLQILKLRLEDLPPREHLRPYDVIAQLAETISATRTRGYDIGDLVDVLADVGIKLSRNTVRNYLSRARRASAARMRSACPAATPTSNSAIEGASPKTAAAPAPMTPVLARALERAQQLRDSNNASDSAGRTAGSFTMVPDTEEL